MKCFLIHLYDTDDFILIPETIRLADYLLRIVNCSQKHSHYKSRYLVRLVFIAKVNFHILVRPGLSLCTQTKITRRILISITKFVRSFLVMY